MYPQAVFVLIEFFVSKGGDMFQQTRIAQRPNIRSLSRVVSAGLSLILLPGLAAAQIQGFQIEEASIAGIQNGIKSGQTTCKAVVQAYIDRAKAYNGTCTALVTADGKPIPAATGAIRAGSPITFPTSTVPLSSLFPDLKDYAGLPFELGRMESTISDPTVQQQWGMRVGIPNAGQLNALETINIRGERSVTCKGDFDRAPSAGPLPAGAPSVCEEFRKQPDALERAAELDKQFGTNPDLAKLPMYCAVFTLKNWYDAKDMRGTGGNDVNFAMDVPKYDSPDIADLRNKGAIIYAIATADNVGGAPHPGRTSPEPTCRLETSSMRSGAVRPAIHTTPLGSREARARDPEFPSRRTWQHAPSVSRALHPAKAPLPATTSSIC
jgi:hypothetical protein